MLSLTFFGGLHTGKLANQPRPRPPPATMYWANCAWRWRLLCLLMCRDVTLFDPRGLIRVAAFKHGSLSSCVLLMMAMIRDRHARTETSHLFRLRSFTARDWCFITFVMYSSPCSTYGASSLWLNQWNMISLSLCVSFIKYFIKYCCVFYPQGHHTFHQYHPHTNL